MVSGDKVIDRVERGEYLRADVFDAKMNDFESVNRQLTSKIEVLSIRMDGLEARVTALRNSVFWQFAFATVIAVIIGIILGAVISVVLCIKRIDKQRLSRSEFETIISEGISNSIKKHFKSQEVKS